MLVQPTDGLFETFRRLQVCARREYTRTLTSRLDCACGSSTSAPCLADVQFVSEKVYAWKCCISAQTLDKTRAYLTPMDLERKLCVRCNIILVSDTEAKGRRSAIRQLSIERKQQFMELLANTWSPPQSKPATQSKSLELEPQQQQQQQQQQSSESLSVSDELEQLFASMPPAMQKIRQELKHEAEQKIQPIQQLYGAGYFGSQKKRKDPEWGYGKLRRRSYCHKSYLTMKWNLLN